MAYEESYQKFSTDSIFTGMIDMDGTIYQANMRSNRAKIGIDAQREQELLTQIEEMTATLDNYREKLIELGVIEVPKTPEEIAQEQLKIAQEQAEQQARINQSLLDAVTGLQEQIKEMKADGMDGKLIEFGGNTIRSTGEADGEKPTASKTSNRARKKNPAASNEQS